jgi:hypothetical protein
MGLIILLVFGIICALIANSKGRSAVGWFFLGVFFHIFTLIVVLIVSDLKAQEQRFSELERENSRLRERVRRDRIVANRQFSQIDSRLRAHDRVLNLDTANVPEEDSLLAYEEQDIQADPPSLEPVRRAPRPDLQG